MKGCAEMRTTDLAKNDSWAKTRWKALINGDLVSTTSKTRKFQIRRLPFFTIEAELWNKDGSLRLTRIDIVRMIFRLAVEDLSNFSDQARALNFR